MTVVAIVCVVALAALVVGGGAAITRSLPQSARGKIKFRASSGPTGGGGGCDGGSGAPC
ncbi:hypothetical protein [Actinomycetospora aeridis]|uniref:Uncharacterized protein n=1 Tax=Actinomycetospora aeridis TaxID=3129231 RepID=A0ABU8N1Q1_9PSEU